MKQTDARLNPRCSHRLLVPNLLDAAQMRRVKMKGYTGPKLFEPHRDKTNKMACAPSEDSDQPGHPPSLIRLFAVRLMGR